MCCICVALNTVLQHARFFKFFASFLMFFIGFYYFPRHMLCSPSCGIRPVGKFDQTELEGIMRHSHVHNLQKLVPRRNCLLDLTWVYSPRELHPRGEVAHA